MMKMENLKVKTFPLRMSDKLNHSLKMLAAKRNVPLQAWIMEAVSEKMSKENKAV